MKKSKSKKEKEEQAEVAEQLEFIEWLKSKGIYNRMESWMVMQTMMRVWKEMKKDAEAIHQMYAEESAGINI